MKRLMYATVLPLLISSCAGSSTLSNVDAIVYTDFTHPKETYDSLRMDFLQSNLVDSIKIIGYPIQEQVIDIQLDTARALQLGLSLEAIKDTLEIARSKLDTEVLKGSITFRNNLGQEIPLSAFSKIMLVLEYYEPNVYIPSPEIFFFEDKRAIKMVFYCKKRDQKKLIELISSKLYDYSHNFIHSEWKFEVVK